jgi:hypothetical protein
MRFPVEFLWAFRVALDPIRTAVQSNRMFLIASNWDLQPMDDATSVIPDQANKEFDDFRRVFPGDTIHC